MMKKLIFLILIMLICIPAINAYYICNTSNISFTTGELTDTSVKLFWNSSCASYVDVYKNNELIYPTYSFNQTIFTELKSNTPYSFMVINGTCAYIKDVTTKLTSTQQINFYLNAFLFLFISLGFLLIAIFLRTKIMAGLSLIVMGYGFINALSASLGSQIYIIYGFGLLIVIFFMAVV